MKNKVCIIGGGVIGLSVGWQLVKRGVDVEVLEKAQAGKSAGWVSAGMLAPQAELGFEELELFNLCRSSKQLFPAFTEELKRDSGIEIKLDECGTLMVGFDRDDNERLKRLYDFRMQVNAPAKWLTGGEARELEPLLSPKCTAAIWVEEDGQVDNRELLNALKKAFISCGGKLYEDHEVESILIKDNQLKGIRVHDLNIEFDYVIVCAGSWSKTIAGIPGCLLPPVHPVKGQIMSLRMDNTFKITRAIRNDNVYLVPKTDGRLVVGATVEDMGFDTNPTAGAVMDMLRDAWEAVPAVYYLNIESIDVGLRPGSKDNLPIVSDCSVQGLYFATGHYRSGVLLAPVTAYELANWITTGKKSEILSSFSLSRFYQEAL
jgi:glycine oxidase